MVDTFAVLSAHFVALYVQTASAFSSSLCNLTALSFFAAGGGQVGAGKERHSHFGLGIPERGRVNIMKMYLHLSRLSKLPLAVAESCSD